LNSELLLKFAHGTKRKSNYDDSVAFDSDEAAAFEAEFDSQRKSEALENEKKTLDKIKIAQERLVQRQAELDE
jgi:hypothetical protein